MNKNDPVKIIVPKIFRLMFLTRYQWKFDWNTVWLVSLRVWEMAPNQNQKLFIQKNFTQSNLKSIYPINQIKLQVPVLIGRWNYREKIPQKTHRNDLNERLSKITVQKSFKSKKSFFLLLSLVCTKNFSHMLFIFRLHVPGCHIKNI